MKTMRSPFCFSVVTILAGLISASALKADSLAPACVTDTLAAYERFNSDVQCSNGILTPLSLGPLSGGFSLSAVDPTGSPFAVAFGQTATYLIDWHFDIDAGPEADGASMGMDPPAGDASATQSYCNDSFNSIIVGTSGSTPGCTVFSDTGAPTTTSAQTFQVSTIPPALVNSIVFSPPAFFFANVRTTIVLNGDDATSTGCPTGAGGSCFDSLLASTVIVDPVPEPVTVLLALGGLAAIYGLQKFRLRA
jgi:hypothetical protein